MPATAAALAAELEPSTRTVNRAVADLMARRVPITGEAGCGDPLLSCVARDVVAKVVAVVPEYHPS